MWFRRKQTNRRLGRVHVLDVKLRSDQVRRARVRAGGLVLAGFLGLGLGGMALWWGGNWALNQLVYENSTFAIRQIEVQTDGVISPEQLRRWARVRPGENLFALELARVKRDLQFVPMIATVAVERVLPSTLRIRVTEREPVVQITVPRANANGTLQATVFHLDAEGVVMLPLDPRQRVQPLFAPDESLPVLFGLSQLDAQQLNTPVVRAALRLAVEFPLSPMAGFVDLRRIDVSQRDVLVVTTAQGAEVTLALDNLEFQLRRWRVVHDEGMRLGRNIAFLDLAVANNVPVRWLEARFVPPPAKAPKPLRNRIPHV
jgi:cell division septal protein FtsQ